jgi:hypothetical protein
MFPLELSDSNDAIPPKMLANTSRLMSIETLALISVVCEE